MADKEQLLARLRRLSMSFHEENYLSTPPEWERDLEQAEEGAYVAGASEAEIERARDYHASWADAPAGAGQAPAAS